MPDGRGCWYEPDDEDEGEGDVIGCCVEPDIDAGGLDPDAISRLIVC